MADVIDHNKRSIELPWATIVAGAVAAAGVFLYLNPIQTARPVERTGLHSDLGKPQDADARLWQDALRAASEHEASLQWKLKDSVTEQPKEEHHLERVLVDQLHNRECWVLAVMIPGSAYAEFTEARLRMRHAVLEGLGKNKYVPVDGEHIGYIKVNDPAGPWHEMILPYEWCHRDVPYGERSASLPDDVCVLWLRDEEFRDHPLSQLDCLLCAQEHLGLCSPESGNRTNNVKTRIIGPYSSNTLRSMIEEAAEPGAGPQVLENVDMWSPTATVDDKLLLKGISKFATYSKVDQVFQAASDSRFGSFSFKRTTRTDAEVTQKLVDELQNNRCLDLFRDGKEGRDWVALISEWDTLFGRALPWSTRRAIIATGTAARTRSLPCSAPYVNGEMTNLDETCRDQLVDQMDRPNNVLTFNYLRGIDGMVPGAATFNEARPKSEQAKVSLGQESTEGLNQADYLRRLSKKLLDADADLRKKKNSRIKAIGVLGADVYDKLLVLQALRRMFPDVIFFTNNIDARLAHPEEWRWARNLLVASPFGLALRNDVQNVPPFRDNNQTAIYTTTYLISRGVLAADFDAKTLGPVRLYEIGRYGAFDLTANVNEESLQPSSSETQLWWNPSRWKAAVGIFSLVIIGLIWICCMILGRRTDSLKRIVGSSWMMFICLAIMSVIAVWVINRLVSGNGADAEPYSWTDGVSVWPTDTFRLFACLLSIFYIVKTSFALSKNECDLQSEFGLLGCHGKRKPSPHDSHLRVNIIMQARTWLESLLAWWKKESLRTRLRDWIGLLAVNWRHCEVNGFVDSQMLWQSYVRSGRQGVRFFRILPLVICYFLAGSLLFDLFGPPHGLARGLAIPWDYWLGRSSAFALVLLTFYVADATLLNRRLIEHLTRRPTRWPSEAYNKLRARWSCGDPTVPPNNLLVDYLDIELIAVRTEVVGGLIYYPFVITSLLILSRASIFDYWTWSPPLLLLIGLTVAIAAFSASYLRRTAERARSHALQSLHDSLIAYVAMGNGDSKDAQLIRETADLINSESRGAFAAISQHPLAGALLLPSGSAGIWALLQYFPRLLGG